MKSASKLLLAMLVLATITPVMANHESVDEQEKVTLSGEGRSKLHWVGLATSLWLLKIGLKDLTAPGVGMLMAPDQIVEGALAQVAPEQRDNIREQKIARVKIQGPIFTLLGMAATYSSAKLAWFFAKKTIKGSDA